MKYLLFTATVFCAIVFKSYAQEAAPNTQTYSFTVQDCINYAYEHQDSVINAKLDIKSAEYKVKETTGIGLPQVSGTVSFQDYLKTPEIILGGQKFSIYQKYTNNYGLNLNQLLFDGTYIVGLQASKTYKELSQRSYTRSKIEATVNVTKAYYQVLVSNEQIRLLDANITQLKQQLDQTVAQNKQGFVEKIDVDRITVQYNNLVTNKENTVRLLELNYQFLKFQMGMPIENELILKDKLADVPLNANVSESVTDTTFYRNRIEYGLTETSLKLNQLDLKRKKAQFLPSLSFSASTALNYQENSLSKLYNITYPSTFIGLTLNIPIINGGQRINQVRQSQISVLKSKNDLLNVKNALSLQANQARIVYVNGLHSLDNQKQNQSLAQEVLRVSKIKYQQGVGSSIEVTQAQTSLEDADNKYIQSLYDALVSKVDLDKAYGRIK